MRMMENENILEIVEYLYKHAIGWEIETAIIYSSEDKHRVGPKYDNVNTIEKMMNEGVIEKSVPRLEIRVKHSRFTSQSDFLPTYQVSYKKSKLAEYLIKYQTLKWGDLTISPNGVFEYKNIKSSILFTIDSQIRKFIAYLLFLGDASNSTLCELIGIPIPLPDRYKTKSKEIIDKYIIREQANRIKIIRSQAITELVDVYNLKREITSKMFKNRRGYGYYLIDYDVLESKSL